MGGAVEEDPDSSSEGRREEAAGVSMGTSWAQLGRGHSGAKACVQAKGFRWKN